MPRYRKKPVDIEAVEFDEKRLLPKGVVIRERGGWEVYNALHDSWIKVKIGDMIRVDKAPTDVYPIDRKTFDETYEPHPSAANVG